VFPPEQVAVIEGGAEVAKALLELPFDPIFFTGSTRVGTLVAQAAAQQLIPITLELGGKCPVIIDESANLKNAAERIVWGKFLNAGQTCIAPDYVFVPSRLRQEFVAATKTAVANLYPTGECACHMVTSGHFERLKKLLSTALAEGGTLVCGGGFDDSLRSIQPTVIDDVRLESSIMHEEIFGPLLPIVSYDSIAAVKTYLLSKPKPLALYSFGEGSGHSIIDEVPSGGACINNTVIHVLNAHLPFGGIGASGMGNYHGVHGFRTFSHAHSVMTQRWGNGLRPLYPPYTAFTQRLIRFAIRWLPGLP